MRFSAIEIGTSSTKLAIGECNSRGAWQFIEKSSISNRLGSGIFNGAALSIDAMEREMEIIGWFLRHAETKRAGLPSIFATSVLRDARNRPELLKRVRESFGINIHVISGQEEAFLALKACRKAAGSSARFAVVDIGGGSTEISIGSTVALEQGFSLDMGAIRLSETFVRKDPITPKEICAISHYSGGLLSTIMPRDTKGIPLIGMGGTLKSVGTIYTQRHHSHESEVDGLVLQRQEVEFVFDFLARLSMEKKRHLMGLNPKRADTITAGMIILIMVMKKLGAEDIKLSTCGVLEGYMEEYLTSRAAAAALQTERSGKEGYYGID